MFDSTLENTRDLIIAVRFSSRFKNVLTDDNRRSMLRGLYTIVSGS